MTPELPAHLTDAEAASRLAEDGPNELPEDRARSLLRLAVDVVTEPMILLLLASGGAYLLLGDPGEAAVLMGFVVVMAAITVGSEWRTERAVAALRDLTSPRARVVRSGAERRIPGREVVRGDLLLLAEGDRVPADAELVDGGVLSLDESLLTGESAPVDRRPITAASSPADAALYGGTLIVRGRGSAVVRATGPRSAIGRIGRSLAEAPPERGRLHAEVDRLVWWVGTGAVALCGVVVLTHGLSGRGWLEGLLAGLTLAMALLPEEFPVVLTVFLGLGAWRLSQRRALTRRTEALGSLAGLTVLCTDKTGTLTANRMAIRRLAAPDGAWQVDEVEVRADLPEEAHALVEHGVLASQADPFDPMEQAFHALATRTLSATEHVHSGWTLDRAYPLEPTLLALSHAWRGPEGRLVVSAKGAPEAIAELCHLAPDLRRRMEDVVAGMARDGLRVLAVATARFDGDQTLPVQHDYDFDLLGLVGLVDPVRPAVPSAVATARRAGIRVVMITGDHPATARAIATEAGIAVDGAATGPELGTWDAEQLRQRVSSLTVLARAVPEDKLRLVRALQQAGEVVGMTGDGVNDAPALRAADVGIAMGGRGTDVAREAAAIVLTDDDFSTIVEAVRLARGLRSRLQRALVYIVAVHVPMAGLSLLPPLFGWPALLGPVHVALLEIFIDPACTLVFDAEPEDGGDPMTAPPPVGNVLDGASLARGLVSGGALLAVLVAALASLTHLEEGAWRALGFGGFLLGNVALLQVGRSWRRPLWRIPVTRNRPAAVIAAVAMGLVVSPWLAPAVATGLRVEAPPIDVGIGLAAAVAVAVAAADRLVGGARRG